MEHRPHRVLEKKLHELEIRFTDLFFPTAANTMNSWRNPAADHELLSNEIDARVDFLKNLLSIEKECRSHGNAPSDDLVKLEERLDGLNTAFRDWMDGGDFLKTEVPEDVTECSCSRSCFSSEDGDGGDEEEEEVIVNDEEKEKDLEKEGSDIVESDCFELELKEDARILDVKRSDVEQFEEKQKETLVIYRPKFCLLRRITALVGAAALVSVGVIVLISESLGGFQDDVFLVPT